MPLAFKLGVVLSLLTTVAPVPAQTLHAAAAADPQYAMGELASRFEKQSGIKVVASNGSSGNFRSQIQSGSPFDLFLSADAAYPQQLVAGGFADADTLTVHAHGHLVLWVSADEQLGLAEKGFQALEDPRVQKIAVANMEIAPYGRAAIIALQKAGLREAVKSKLIFGENISQAAQFAQSRSAQVGMLAHPLTFADAMNNGEKWEIPADLYPVIEQAAVVVRSAAHKKAARAFLDSVKSREGQRIRMRYGLSPGGAEQQP